MSKTGVWDFWEVSLKRKGKLFLLIEWNADVMAGTLAVTLGLLKRQTERHADYVAKRK